MRASMAERTPANAVPLARPADFAADGTTSAALPEGGRVLLIRDGSADHGSGVRAYLDRCPHRGGTLGDAEGRFLDAGSGLIRCARHGALFLTSSGECLSGPCQGDRLTPLAVSVDDTGAVYLAVQ